MSDPYAAVRFDAWKSLQTLPGFSDFPFNYTSDDRALSETATRAIKKWFRTVRDVNSFFAPETGLDSSGRFRQDIFQRLRTERDDKPIVLAE